MEQNELTELTAHTARRFYELSRIAGKNGISALKDYIDKDRNDYRDVFEYGLLLYVKGIDAAYLDKTLSNIINHEKDDNKKRLKLIQKEAALHIQRGSHPKIFLCALFSYLDINELNEVKDLLSESVICDDINSFLEKPFINEEIEIDNNDDSPACAVKPFEFLNQADINILSNEIKQEQPQVTAYVLASIEPQKAALVLSGFSDKMQSDIAYKIAVMDIPGIELLCDILLFEKKLLKMSGKKHLYPESENFKKLLKAYLVRSKAVKGAYELYKEASQVTAGSDDASILIKKLLTVMQGTPVDFLSTNPVNLLKMLEEEHPKTIACILSVLEPEKAALIFQFLPASLQCGIAHRMVLMEKNDLITEEMRAGVSEISPSEIKRIEKKLSAMLNKTCVFESGLKKLIDLLFLAGKSAYSTVLKYLNDTYPELSETIEDYLFVFEDIVMLDDSAIQRVLRYADRGNLIKALKNTTETVRSRIFDNISKRAAVMLKEDLDCMGPVSEDECEKAKKEFVWVIRKLEEIGEIVLADHD